MADLSGHRKRLKKRYFNYLTTRNAKFTDYEFLEFLLTYAIPRKDVKQLAKDLLKKYGTINNIINQDIYTLMDEKDLGESSALFLKGLSDLVKNISYEKLKDESAFNSMTKIHTKSELIKFLRTDMSFLNQEIFKVLFLNSANRLVKVEDLFMGTIDTTPAFPRIIIEKSLKYGATGLILAHNHPSGDVRPSQKDIIFTKDIKQKLKSLDMILLDHIIISKNSYFSFYEDNLL